MNIFNVEFFLNDLISWIRCSPKSKERRSKDKGCCGTKCWRLWKLEFSTLTAVKQVDDTADLQNPGEVGLIERLY